MKEIKFFKEKSKPKEKELDLKKLVKTGVVLTGSALLLGAGLKFLED